MPTTQNIHGHEVLRLVGQARPALSRQGLHEEVRRRFGDEARFRTCAGGDMTLTQLVDFLLARGKLAEEDGVLYADLRQMCDDDEH